MLHNIFELLFTFFFSMTSLYFLSKVAIKVGLVDKPNERKHHKGSIPLVGGLSVTISLLFYLFRHYESITIAPFFALSVIVLVAVGVWDDKCDISFKIRLFVQAVLSLILVFVVNIKLHTVGNILEVGHIDFGILASVITVFAVIGAINAFNMVDGIDGLLGGLSIVTFASIGIMTHLNGMPRISYHCLIVIVCILPYLLFNLGFIGKKRKVFMGDAGSMLIGYTIIVFLLAATQQTITDHRAFRPVVALWFIAVPLLDMIVIMIRRIRRGDSPFKPDREHLHHICQRIGFTSRQSLGLILLIASIYSFIGMMGEWLHVRESIMLILFLILGFWHYYAITHAFKLTKYIRLQRRKFK
ncbi:UDP-N-acetylglucosamine--undecaprenyl-phosphate N-acetylglucosaminephosphotransferase [Vibrio sp. SS-MA-C1-2]|uniref:UDP-N-acetylglucosamine--undecaprenyl-phosphate N-acetylglucosaminephosphotransferase n=1 Tax=Vibrio sp. SS-MA-C1-2 TaxID=2908646 RepID=UPI001F405E67|nr:UDP-N-acetylglucosamine--undecaprenyl-phosphate N-acetylglucosaminephosphotransferase [Vibrio sp. SS-MA-C1-2]UJF18545.1 UDP-N-acetylglucosamine--undecaprenyl-phosphate N-acetylglucosaminephosphotransferase [Vibrio sp. SS-MA-C1-2]